MLAMELKRYLQNVNDSTNILVFVAKTGETRQLLVGDLDKNHDGNLVIDAEYDYPAKHTQIEVDNG